MTIINTNISAVAAQNSLRTSGLNQTSAMERLSSGVRINSAKDDAAGLAISTRMTANIRGLAAAIRNANDGISLTQTAEGSLISIGDNLQRIRELAVQSANSTNNTTDRAALHAEAAQLVSEIDRIANNATFNGVKLLDGSYQNQALQVGSGNEANDRITISIGNARASALGVGGGSSFSTTLPAAPVVAAVLASGDLTINGYNIGGTTSDGVSFINSSGSAIAKANAINAVSGQTGVTAVIGASASSAITAGANAGAFALVVNGVAISGNGDGTSATVSASRVAAAFNAVSSQTGVTAVLGTGGNYSLSAADGRNITISEGSGNTAAVANITFTSATEPGAGSATSAARYYGTLTLQSSSPAGITLGGTGAAAVGKTAGANAATAADSAGVSSVNLATASGSQAALNILDKAINTVTDSRASMGAYQNRLAASISNLEVSSMNLQASRSRILDTDYAKETTNLAKSQIIQQAATAMLAQANQAAQSVLSLLK
jgi:flagellin